MLPRLFIPKSDPEVWPEGMRIHAWVNTYIGANVFIYTCMYMFVCMHMFVCVVYACYVVVNAYLDVCEYVYVYIHPIPKLQQLGRLPSGS